jgi:hypothetical protein
MQAAADAITFVKRRWESLLWALAWAVTTLQWALPSGDLVIAVLILAAGAALCAGFAFFEDRYATVRAELGKTRFLYSNTGYLVILALTLLVTAVWGYTRKDSRPGPADILFAILYARSFYFFSFSAGFKVRKRK